MSATLWAPRLVLPVSAERDHVRGSAMPRLVLVEYGDYECPHCGAAHPIVKEVQARLGEELRFVFRNFPLTTVHPHAERPPRRRKPRCAGQVLGDARYAVQQPGAARQDLIF